MRNSLDPRPSSLSRLAFVERFGGIYEHSPWVAEGAFAAGLTAAEDQPEALASRMASIVEAAGPDRQLALLRAHPELAGKLAIAGNLTADSRAEQASARLDQCTPAEFARFQDLNAAYNARFGFPFIIAVRGLQRADILAAFERRAGNDRAAEFREALEQVHKIARLRLAALAAQ
jgi:2-oxo-4-hydroxy-4-carboxy-5-ureidoimidazoline decarboxylase